MKYTLVYVPEGARPDDEHSDMYDKCEGVESDDYSENLIDKYSQIILDVSNETTVKSSFPVSKREVLYLINSLKAKLKYLLL